MPNYVCTISYFSNLTSSFQEPKMLVDISHPNWPPKTSFCWEIVQSCEKKSGTTFSAFLGFYQALFRFPTLLRISNLIWEQIEDSTVSKMTFLKMTLQVIASKHEIVTTNYKLLHQHAPKIWRSIFDQKRHHQQHLSTLAFI